MGDVDYLFVPMSFDNMYAEWIILGINAKSKTNSFNYRYLSPKQCVDNIVDDFVCCPCIHTSSETRCPVLIVS